MSTTINATFDGTVFHPTEPVTLPPNSKVRLIIDEVTAGTQELPEKTGEPYSFLELLGSLDIEGPPDWSENLDEYLYHGKTFD